MFYENVCSDVCSAEQVRRIDADAVSCAHIPSIILMESAAAACVRALEEKHPRRAVILCGRGNNGGDGLAIARQLCSAGVETIVILVNGDNFSGDALINYNMLSNFRTTENGSTVGIYDFEAENTDLYISSADAVIDAIYGTGLHGEVTGNARRAIEAVNRYSRFTLSVDIPSGINADTGEICGVCVRADVTVTFAAYKKGLLLYPGAGYTGKIIIDRIFIPENIIRGNNTGNIFAVKPENLRIPERAANSHKGDYGKILIAGGSRGMSGAPVMAAQAALMSGGGLITAAVPAEINPVMENKLTEVMSIPLQDFRGEMTSAAAAQILEKDSDALLFGVGAGRGEDIVYILEKLIQNYDKTLVIDADGLFALSKNPEMLHRKKCEIIITPHEGEFARLTGKAVPEMKRIDMARGFAEKYGITVVLKGSRTITANADSVYINMSGNAGMASGGSGDVLAGMITAFAARGLPPCEAAVLAVGLHGIAGDIDMETGDIESVTAGGIIRNIPDAYAYIRRFIRN